MAFYNLAKLQMGGNWASDILKALLSSALLKSMPHENLLVSIDDLLEKGRVGEAWKITDSTLAQ